MSDNIHARGNSYKINKPLLQFIIFLLLILVATGCWNRAELNQLALAVALGIDKEDDLYKLSVQVVQPHEVKRPSYFTPVSLYTATSKDSLFEAIRKMTTGLPRKLHLSHVKIFVISEELAREGIGKVLDLLIRDHEVRPDFYTIVAKDTKAEDVLKVMTRLEIMPAMKLYESLSTSQDAWATTAAITFDELMKDIVSKGNNVVLSGLVLKGNPEVGTLKESIERVDVPTISHYHGLAVFKNDKLIGWLNGAESKMYNYIQGKVKSTIASVPCPKKSEKERVYLEVKKAKSNINGEIKDGKPHISVELSLDMNIGEVHCEHLNISDPQTLVMLEKKLEKEMEKMILETVESVKTKFGSDIFGFGESIQRSSPSYWKEHEQDWSEIFKETEIRAKVKAKIRLTGSIDRSFIKLIEE